MVAITLEDICVRYGEQHSGRPLALRDLNLHVASGELLVLAGPSGSGKSTVLRTIAGLEIPIAGTVRIDGRDVRGLSPGQRDIAFVSQFQSLFPHLNVEQNLQFALQLRKVPQAETRRRVTAEARVLGLWSKRLRRPNTLSTGERQRAALGRATTRRPAIYLFDEPLAGLDPAERDRMRRELHRLQRGLGVTTVYVTHDQREAMALGTRVAVLDAGRVVQVDEPLALYRRPETLFVAEFLGTPPMGLLRGRLRDDGSTAWVDLGDASLRLLPEQRAVVGSVGFDDAAAIGVRAPAVHLAEHPPEPWTRRLRLHVATIEPLGAQTVVGLAPSTRDAATSRLYATVPPTHRVVVGTQVDVTIDMRDSFVFDVATGRRRYPTT